MGRIIELLAFFMIAYFTLKSWLRGPTSSPRREGRPAGPKKHDFGDTGEMKQDPVCGTYVEAQSAIFIIRDDKKVWFCSEGCREKYLEGLKGERIL
ncbi:MAG TPA: transcriptional regulator [bacterium]|nr:transcriptional regulator [bacterium]